MIRSLLSLIFVSLTMLCSPQHLLAQQTRVLPRGYDKLEGNSSYAYPFRVAGAVQMIYGGKQLASSGTAVISGVGFRANAPFDAELGFKKAMRLDAYGTTVSPAAMGTNPVANVAGAKATQVFSGSVSLPAISAQLRAPAAAFALTLPFTNSYLLDTAKHNLCLHLQPGDNSGIPSGTDWRLDAVSHRRDKAFARKAKIGERCADAKGRYLSLSVASTAHDGGVLGVTIRRSSATPQGTFPLAILGLDMVTGRSPVPLAALGMPGCHLQVDPQVFWFQNESAAGTYANPAVSLASTSAFVGTPYVLQAVGVARPKFGLAGSVVTDSWQVVHAPGADETPANQGIFFNASQGKWAMSGVGAYYPVTQFRGVFP